MWELISADVGINLSWFRYCLQPVGELIRAGLGIDYIATGILPCNVIRNIAIKDKDVIVCNHKSNCKLGHKLLL